MLPVRIELTTSPLPRECSTTELRQRRALLYRTGREGATQDVDGRAKLGHAAWTGRTSVPNLPPMTEGTKARAKAAREARLRAALRENLRRRKAQARGRGQDEPQPREGEFTPSKATSDKPER